LYFIGDTHIGSEAADAGRISALAQTIKADKRAAIIGLGDYIEAIAISDRRFDAAELKQPISPEHLSNPFYCQALRFAKIFEPTQGKWICLVSGNHENKALHNYHVDATQIIADRLGAAYLGGSEQSGWIRLQLRDKNRHLLHSRLGRWGAAWWGCLEDAEDLGP
jgi:UDP-2,3-diacylglucosamine pyrophosphatase LpxH